MAFFDPKIGPMLRQHFKGKGIHQTQSKIGSAPIATDKFFGQPPICHNAIITLLINWILFPYGHAQIIMTLGNIL